MWAHKRLPRAMRACVLANCVRGNLEQLFTNQKKSDPGPSSFEDWHVLKTRHDLTQNPISSFAKILSGYIRYNNSLLHGKWL